MFQSRRAPRLFSKIPTPVSHAKQLRPEEVDALEAKFRETQRLAKAANALGITRGTAAKLLGERGIDTSRRRMSSMETQLAADAYVAGDSAATIGKRLDFAPHTVIKTLRAAGMPIRPRPGRG